MTTCRKCGLDYSTCVHNPVSSAGRYVDLMRQGFMKPLPKPRAKKAPPPIVACRGCENWHRKGSHSQPDPLVRRANEKRYREADKRAGAIRTGAVVL